MFDCKEGPLLASLTMSVGQFLRLAAGQISPLYSLYSLHTFVFSVFSVSAHLCILCILCTQNYGDKGRLGRCRAAGNRTQFRFIGKEKEERVVGIPVAWSWVAAAYDLAAGAAR